MIPKNIFTIWISDNKKLPQKYEAWCKTHHISGYTHHYITLQDCSKIKSKYLKECIQSKHWIKVTDYVRIYFLYTKGGIYLDCDIEVIKPFDDLLNNTLFTGREDPYIISNSIIGAEKGHLLLKKYLDLVENNFKGGGDMILEPAERLFTDLILGKYGRLGGVTTYSAEYFFPKDEKTTREEITKNTYAYHHFQRSWKK